MAFTAISFFESLVVVAPGPNAVLNRDAALPPALDTASACAILSSRAARSASPRDARCSADCGTALLAARMDSIFWRRTSQKLFDALLSTLVLELFPVDCWPDCWLLP